MPRSRPWLTRLIGWSCLSAGALPTAVTAQVDSQSVLPKIADAQRRSPAATPVKDVVLTIEGGGSLGVHEAGMTWALVELFKRRERPTGTDSNPDLPQLRLSTVSGASAGSINALLAATAWCDRRVLPPEQSALWKAWVPTGVQQLLPRHNMTGFRRAAGMFSRDYFLRVLLGTLTTTWDSASWAPPGECRIPVGATLTRLEPEVVTLSGSHVSARNQRWASTFTLTTRDAGHGRYAPVFLARPGDGEDPSMGTVAVPPAGPDSVIPTDRVFDIFMASSGYPLAFGPYTVAYRRPDGRGGWRTDSAQFSDGGVFDNGPLGLGLAMHFGHGDWVTDLARNPALELPLTVFVTPGRRRVWPDTRMEEEPASATEGRLIDPRATGVAAVFRLVGGAVPSARQRELQQTLRVLDQVGRIQRGTNPAALPPSAYLLASTRWHAITGERLGGFGAFLGRPFREYDFYVGIYDALVTVAEGVCSGDTVIVRRRACVSRRVAALIARPPMPLGDVAPEVLRVLFAREFDGVQPDPAAVRVPPVTSADSVRRVVLAVERSMGAFMQDTSAQGRRVQRSLRRCPGGRGPLIGVVCESGLRAMVDTLRADSITMQVLRAYRGAGHDACTRRAPPSTSTACRADERFLALVQQPMEEMHRVARSLLDRVIVTTPDSSAADWVVRAMGLYYFSSDERYRRGIDFGQTSVPPREEEWHALPSSITASVGIPGVITGWEARYNPFMRFGLVLPARVAVGRLQPGNPRRLDRTTRLITGPAVEYKLHRYGMSALRVGYNLWFGSDSLSRALPLRKIGGAYVGASIFANKLRLSAGQRPSSLASVRPHGMIYEIGLGDVNGLLYWAIEGVRGSRHPGFREP